MASARAGSFRIEGGIWLRARAGRRGVGVEAVALVSLGEG